MELVRGVAERSGEAEGAKRRDGTAGAGRAIRRMIPANLDEYNNKSDEECDSSEDESCAWLYQ